MPKFVTIKNICKRSITIYLRFLRPKKKDKPPPPPITLAPGEKSHALPYPFLVGGKNWDALNRAGCISLETVAWRPQFVRVTPVQRVERGKPITLDVVPPPRKGKPKKSRPIVLRGKRQSRAVHLRSIVQRRKLKSLARKKKVALEPVSYLGPPIGKYPSVGSFGYDDVYVCWDCGGPIVFRGSPPVPIHV